MRYIYFTLHPIQQAKQSRINYNNNNNNYYYFIYRPKEPGWPMSQYRMRDNIEDSILTELESTHTRAHTHTHTPCLMHNYDTMIMQFYC